jgi:hypothetical protein
MTFNMPVIVESILAKYVSYKNLNILHAFELLIGVPAASAQLLLMSWFSLDRAGGSGVASLARGGGVRVGGAFF